MLLVRQKENDRYLETCFSSFRENMVGLNQSFEPPYGKQKIIYADWTASGRLCKPIEEKLLKEIEPSWPTPIKLGCILDWL